MNGEIAARRAEPGEGELVALIALTISLVALAIDAMLPALPAIGLDLQVARANDTQLVITAMFGGFAAGQMLYGPLSDAVGRKPAIYAGLILFIAGSLLSAFATSFGVMLLGRALQGIGAAGPRIVTVAMVRDRFEGRAMARIMSLVMSVFILVPVIAPALGQGVLAIAGWRAIFGVFMAVALVVLVWFGLRLPESLPPERRVPFSLRQIVSGIHETCTNRTALGYTLSGGLVFGGFIGYLSSCAQIFLDQYRVGAHFPWYFGALALAIGAAAISNARLVMRYGMRRLSMIAVLVLSGVSLGFLGVAATVAGHPPLWSLMAYLAAAFFCFGILFGNFNALALEQLGHIAGMAAAVVGTLTTLLSLVLGSLIGQAFDGTVLPLVGGFSLLGCLSTLVIRWAERGRDPDLP